MRAGQLRRRVTIQSRATTVDAVGQISQTWTTVLSGVPAHIEPLSGRELIAAAAVQSAITHRVTVRYHRDLAAPVAANARRIVFGDRYFNVQSVLNIDERNRVIEMLTEEGLSNG